mmetsp:Transcript_47103/g.121767  ORF Transcript_47103/g.121767 Transcript_47103/m.121767 type:complete len:217 (+) Transcript_47103:271-921(+)
MLPTHVECVFLCAHHPEGVDGLGVVGLRLERVEGCAHLLLVLPRRRLVIRMLRVPVAPVLLDRDSAFFLSSEDPERHGIEGHHLALAGATEVVGVVLICVAVEDVDGHRNAVVDGVAAELVNLGDVQPHNANSLAEEHPPVRGQRIEVACVNDCVVYDASLLVLLPAEANIGVVVVVVPVQEPRFVHERWKAPGPIDTRAVGFHVERRGGPRTLPE